MRVFAASIIPSLMLAACGAKSNPVPVDPNALPPNYRQQIAAYLGTQLLDRAEYRGAFISAPVLKPVGRSQHIVVCVQLNGHSERKDKVAIYLSGVMTQFVDSTPEQCADAAYQPFRGFGRRCSRQVSAIHMMDSDVLIVGAGPTGLTLAIDLGRRGVRCTLIEQKERAGVSAEDGAHQCAHHGDLPPHGACAETSAPPGCGPIVRWTSISFSR